MTDLFDWGDNSFETLAALTLDPSMGEDVFDPLSGEAPAKRQCIEDDVQDMDVDGAAAPGLKVDSGRSWTISDLSPYISNIELLLKGAREARSGFVTEAPETMYCQPYQNDFRMTLSLQSTLPNLTYTLDLALNSMQSPLQAALNGPVRGEMVQDTPTSHLCDIRFAIGKGFISYHYGREQFALIMTVYSNNAVVAVCRSAPFTVLAKRKEAVHAYDTKNARAKRKAAQMSKPATPAELAAGILPARLRQIEDVVQSIAAWTAPEQEYLRARLSALPVNP